jgi:vancomycin resistance protein VanJ
LLRAAFSSLFRSIGRLILAAIWVFGLALVAWNLARVYPGDRWLPIRLGSFFAPWLFMALAPALGAALLARRRWLARLLLLLGLVFGVRYAPLLLPRLSLLQAEAGAAELRVMTFNVHYDNHEVAAIAELIREEEPDVIAMQELTRDLAVALQRELAFEYPYVHYDSSAALTGLFSRYPLSPEPLPPALRYSRRAEVLTPAGPVSVWSLHLAVPLRQRGWERQREMALALAAALEGEARPVVVMGDFNTTYQTENYRLIAEQLTDVHWSIGRGFGFSFPDVRHYTDSLPIPYPVIRIDHVLVSQHFAPREIHVAPQGYGSDHRPVIATLRFTE